MQDILSCRISFLEFNKDHNLGKHQILLDFQFD